ncbi:MAG: SDR family NAD(P)-dependent oxidoreductase [Myxococcota bacterium]|nr:SDR family NAD(P)-dependent oxidoreductase [Deltaproteobacteria bacterium]MDQ3333611.1 SDR family NAD(P)-dependent oxidoreductase [Myxococcota bacterium]
MSKIVVVTGAGSGIGRATSLAFAKEGARIAVCDVDQARLDSLGRELGDRALLVKKVDVSSRAEMSTFADEVHALAPAADVIVNNAGVAIGGTFLKTSLDDWDWLLGINLMGVVHGCHFFIPKMVDRGQGGHVVNISSILGIYPAPNVTAYVASKFAVRGLSQSLRAELEPHKIGVTAICPGMINTSIVADGRLNAHIEGRRSKMVATFAQRGAPPELVAREILSAVRTNPAVRPVGRDAKLIAALTRMAPQITTRLGQVLAKRFGAHD